MKYSREYNLRIPALVDVSMRNNLKDYLLKCLLCLKSHNNLMCLCWLNIHLPEAFLESDSQSLVKDSIKEINEDTDRCWTSTWLKNRLMPSGCPCTLFCWLCCQCPLVQYLSFWVHPPPTSLRLVKTCLECTVSRAFPSILSCHTCRWCTINNSVASKEYWFTGEFLMGGKLASLISWPHPCCPLLPNAWLPASRVLADFFSENSKIRF